LFKSKNQDKFSKSLGLDWGKKYEKSRQKLKKAGGGIGALWPGVGLGPSGRGRDFENEFAGAGEKTRIPAVSGAGISVDHWQPTLYEVINEVFSWNVTVHQYHAGKIS
jgi:hypothetical protein